MKNIRKIIFIFIFIYIVYTCFSTNIVIAGERDILIGLIDSGVDDKEEAIKEYLYCNEKEQDDGIDNDSNGFVDDLKGWNFYDNSNIIYSSDLADYHGTMSARLICSEINEANVKIVPLKAFRGSEASVNDIISAIEYGYSKGVRIFNCSWDMNKYNEKLRECIEQHDDAIFICAAGKCKNNLDEAPVYPACFDLDNVICVGGIEDKSIYEYSGFGQRIDVYAPARAEGMLHVNNEISDAEGTSISTAFFTAYYVNRFKGQIVNRSLLKSKLSDLYSKELHGIVVEHQPIDNGGDFYMIILFLIALGLMIAVCVMVAKNMIRKGFIPILIDSLFIFMIVFTPISKMYLLIACIAFNFIYCTTVLIKRNVEYEKQMSEMS